MSDEDGPRPEQFQQFSPGFVKANGFWPLQCLAAETRDVCSTVQELAAWPHHQVQKQLSALVDSHDTGQVPRIVSAGRVTDVHKRSGNGDCQRWVFRSCAFGLRDFLSPLGRCEERRRSKFGMLLCTAEKPSPRHWPRQYLLGLLRGLFLPLGQLLPRTTGAFVIGRQISQSAVLLGAGSLQLLLLSLLLWRLFFGFSLSRSIR
mmetsp:Transcript_31443/g.70764  ORF Transcript_31443/g.70764 Transcript_31443/m.70764 type:complete len:204 (+) Transcript_31443:883-1494(+)